MDDYSSGEILQGDALRVLDELPANSIHAIVTDPPYNLGGDGFMGQGWDNIGDASEYQAWCQDWAETAKRVLKPGGHIIAFSGNTTHHRLMSGIEDAGYEIRDTITWHYGNGFPKGPQLSTWLDGEDADRWGDWRGMLKPATEFAVLARAPFSGSSTQNQVEHGTANLNIEACRLPTTENLKRTVKSGGQDYSLDGENDNFSYSEDKETGSDDGRFPANLALDPIMAELMDLQAGERGGGEYTAWDGEDTSGDVLEGSRDGSLNGQNSGGYGDSGGPSRFFYCSKASKSERTHDGAVENNHTTVKPIDLMEWLVRLVTAEDQWVLDPFAGSGTTVLACSKTDRNSLGIEYNEEYIEIAEQRLEQVRD